MRRRATKTSQRIARAEPRDRAPVAPSLAADVEQVPAVTVLGKDLDPKLGGEPLHPDVVRTDPLPAEVDGHPVAQREVEQPTADPVPRLQHDHLASGVG